MQDILLTAFGVLTQLAILGGVIYAIYAWRRRQSATDDPDPGMGTLKRLYFYGISFAALMTLVAGISLAVQSLLNTLFDGRAFSLSSNTLAWGLSLFIVALPIWFFHWRFILRSVAAMPVESRSIIRKVYIYLTLGVALGFLAAVSYEILKWAMRAGEFPEFSLASILPWAMIWGYHWQIESAEGQRSMETRGIRRLYLYGASLVGGGMFAVGVGAMIHALLQDGYAALFLTQVTISEQTGLARESLRTDLSVAVVGGAMYWTHWRVFARDDTDSVLRWIALFIASIGGAATALGSVGVMAYTTLSWLLGAATERAALHFEDMPGALVVASVGTVAWALFRRRMLTEAVGEYATPVRRIYDHLMAALGLAALAGASFTIFNTALATFAEALSVSITDSDAWRPPVAAILAMLIIGIPVWGYYWRRLRLTYAADPESEATALSHRVYIFAVLGAGALAFLGGGGGTLFVILRDLLDAALSVETLRDLTPAIGFTLTAALFLPYHWAIYRADQNYQPTETSLDDMSPIQDNVGMEVVYTEVFEIWVRRLRDQRARASIISRIEDGNLGDRRSVGGGVSELRVNVGAGYRVYYTIRQSAVVILLCGGDKSSQQRDIRRAQRMAREVQGAT